jgi:hypothetical protein
MRVLAVLVLLASGCLTTQERAGFANRLALLDERREEVEALPPDAMTPEDRAAALAAIEAERARVLAELQAAKDERVAQVAEAVEAVAPQVGSAATPFFPLAFVAAALVALGAGGLKTFYRRKKP